MQRELLEDSYEGYFDFQQCKPTPWADPEALTDSEVTTNADVAYIVPFR